MYRTIVAAFTVFLMASSAHAQAGRPANIPASASSNPAAGHSVGIQPGTYDLELAFGGGTMPGALTIRAIGDSLDVKLLVNDHAPPIKSVTRNGSTLVLAGSGDGVDVRYDLQFTDESLIGKFTFNGESGAVTGKRRK